VPLANARSLKKKNLSDEVYDELRRQIIAGHLEGGERLDIFRISDELGVSRTPVKEAFNRLALEGLITVHPNRGTFVSSITAETIAHVFDVRLMMEMWAVRTVAKDPKLLNVSEMAEILDRCDRILNRPGDFDWEQFVAADQDLHYLIVNSPGNPMLARMYESLFPQIQLVRVYWSRTRERACLSQEQHRAILAALRDGAAEEVEDVLRSHILSSKEHVLRLLDSNGQKLG
jgi:DNA-binding GntR family transcriptional regulator